MKAQRQSFISCIADLISSVEFEESISLNSYIPPFIRLRVVSLCLLQFSFLGELETPSVSPWVTGAKSRTEGQFGCGQWINERNRSNMQRLHWQWGAFRSGVCKGLR